MLSILPSTSCLLSSIRNFATIVTVAFLICVTVEANNDESVFADLTAGKRSIYGAGLYVNTDDKKKHLAVIVSSPGDDALSVDPDNVYVYDTLASSAIHGTSLQLTGGVPLSSHWKPLYDLLVTRAKGGSFPKGTLVRIAILRQGNDYHALLYNETRMDEYNINAGTTGDLMGPTNCTAFLSVPDESMVSYGHSVDCSVSPSAVPGSYIGESEFHISPLPLYAIVKFTFSVSSGRSMLAGPGLLGADADSTLPLYCCNQAPFSLIGKPKNAKSPTIETVAKEEQNTQGLIGMPWNGSTLRSGFMTKEKVFIFTPKHTVIIFDRAALLDFGKPHPLKTVPFKDFFLRHVPTDGKKDGPVYNDNPDGRKGTSQSGGSSTLGLLIGLILLMLLLAVVAYLFYFRKKKKKSAENEKKKKESGNKERSASKKRMPTKMPMKPSPSTSRKLAPSSSRKVSMARSLSKKTSIGRVLGSRKMTGASISNRRAGAGTSFSQRPSLNRTQRSFGAGAGASATRTSLGTKMSGGQSRKRSGGNVPSASRKMSISRK